MIQLILKGKNMFCMHCGKQVSEEDIFCNYCGGRLKTETTAARANTAAENIKILSNEEPLFRVKCEYCRCEFEYKLENLGKRPWYPSGFVYCPKCNRPLRHKLEYEVKQ